ncbi:efflux RND transporter periplasmic adaptor subunit [Aurantimonas endophytica]|uniref:HlyD family secretion protein n=1 Tax=Aurantimonas endophytica TaxID=1522175 RepID=A0A7W6HDG3_9HYPH|nr:efflux RND transporter periplasmic adaptor subunit [Aurantimonas endophytica]MBB4003113.1 HlyD family secretion protein [Aurantimonas endophytica]MCO6403985.1 efflux RND transporter periplasmic adaptor subunit [Aurantimonas endophytica]
MFVRYPVLLLVLAGLTASAATAQESEAPAATAPQPPSVSVVKATAREIVSTVVVTGTLVPRETVVVGAEVDGLRIEELLADEGDTVAAGAVLARLETDMIETDLARNDSQVARADAALAQAQSQIAEAESAKVEADAALARTRPLADKGIVGRDVLDQRISAAAATASRLASAYQGVSVAEADKALTLAERRQLELKRSKAVITAPTAGLVLSRAARLGAIASASGGGLFEIARENLIELDAQVTESVLNSLAKGQKVTVTLPGTREPIEGTVRLVSPLVDETTRLGRVRVALPPSDLLRSGSFARGAIEIARSRGIVLPNTAVVTDGDESVVQVVRDGTIESRPIRIGINTGSEVEIADGLAEGESVVALAGTFVRDGDRVTPSEMQSAEVRQ